MNKLLVSVLFYMLGVSWGYTVQDGYYPSGIEYYSNVPRPEYVPLVRPITYEGYPEEVYSPVRYHHGQFDHGPVYTHVPYGGEVVDKNLYRKGNQNYNDGVYEKASGLAEEQADHGQNGYKHNRVAIKEGRGDSGEFRNIEGRKNAYDDGKHYFGDEYHGEKGKNGQELKQNQGHKKGHVIKGFKTSHHKDESGKTEEYFDEANDEGDNVHYDGHSGSFGENGASSFKGGHANDESTEKLHKTGGYYDNGHFVDNVHTDQGKFGGNKFENNGRVYGRHNGVHQESLLGSQENSKFYKHSPYFNHFYKQ